MKSHVGRNPAATILEQHQVSPSADRRPRQRPRDATKRCYELAWRYVMDQPDAMLVHGFCDGIAHAWVELPEGLVYDGTCKGFYDRDGYYDTMRANAVRTFSQQEAARFAAENGVFGPWQELAIETAVVPKGGKQ